MPLRFQYNTRAGEFRHVIEEDEAIIRRTGAVAVKRTATLARDNARRNIAGAGNFSKRWLSAMKFAMDKNPPGVIASARVFHSIPFAVIFEEGGTIRGKPKLWLPIEANLPSTGKSWTPRAYAARFGPLVSVNRPGKPPLLFAKTRTKGVVNKPLFVGVDSVNIRKRFAIYDAIKAATDHMGEFYVDALAAENK